jgi:hypothetical protein
MRCALSYLFQRYGKAKVEDQIHGIFKAFEFAKIREIRVGVLRVCSGMPLRWIKSVFIND